MASVGPTPPCHRTTRRSRLRRSLVATGTTAAQLCRSALGTVESATFVTVAEVRDYSSGPSPKSAPHAFPGVAPTDKAAWCWVHDGPHIDTSYAVHAGFPAIRMVEVVGGMGSPSSPPVGIPTLP